MMRYRRWTLGVSLVGLGLGGGCNDGGGGSSASTDTEAESSTSAPATGGGPGSSGDDAIPTASGPGGPGTSSGGEDPDGGSSEGSGSTTGPAVPEGTLEIYWVDVEGGAATLMVTPAGRLVLVDTGNPGDRDADRITTVVEDVIGADRIDVCIVTHYDGDHVGGVPDLAARLPIDEFWDHGEVVESCGGGCQVVWSAYLAVAAGKRTTIVPGEIRDLDGVQLHFVSGHGQLVTEPLPGAGAPNPACEGASSMPPNDNENAMSLGFVARFGTFDFLDLGDLYWFQEDALACPDNLVGPIDLYQTTHHGLTSSGATQLVHGIEPLVVVMNNGPTKGGSEQAYDIVVSAPGDPVLWQLHRAENNDDQHNTDPERIANLAGGAEDQAHWVRATVDGPTGAITMHNARNGHEQTAMSR